MRNSSRCITILPDNSEYLAAFQKTVAMHEVFLTRIASHSVMRDDDNFHVFLEFEKDVRTIALACIRPELH